MHVIRWLLKESLCKCLLAIFASIAGGVMTIGILILLFRFVGKNDELKLWLFVVLSFGAVGCRTLSRDLIGDIGRDAVFSLRTELFRKIMETPLLNIERVGNLKLMAAMTDDISKVAAVLPNLVVLCTNITLILACVIYLGWLSLAKLVTTIAVISVGVLCRLFLQREGVRQHRVSRQQYDDLIKSFHSLIWGVKELKLNAARREASQKAMALRASGLQNSAKRQSLLYGGAALFAQVLFYIALGLAMFDHSGGALDRNLVASYGIAVIYLMAPLQGTIQIVQTLMEADVALDRVEEIGFTLQSARLKREKETDQDMGGASSGVANLAFEFRELELVGVTHSYTSEYEDKKGEFILGPIDLALTKGEILFVVGGNGSGKTTFAKVLAGLYLPAAGAIRINGRAVTRANLTWYSQHFSAVFQDFFIFDDFLGGVDDRAKSVMERLDIHDRLHISQNKIVKSTALSLGERKRVALLLAYLDDKPILLFDEWAAEQDPIFKDIFYKEILQELRALGKLVIVISHDDRYFEVADKLLILERGMPPRQHLAQARGAE